MLRFYGTWIVSFVGSFVHRVVGEGISHPSVVILVSLGVA
jgi:hypothetical protein